MMPVVHVLLFLLLLLQIMPVLLLLLLLLLDVMPDAHFLICRISAPLSWRSVQLQMPISWTFAGGVLFALFAILPRNI